MSVYWQGNQPYHIPINNPLLQPHPKEINRVHFTFTALFILRSLCLQPHCSNVTVVLPSASDHWLSRAMVTMIQCCFGGLMWRPDSSLIIILSQASAAPMIRCPALLTISFLCSQRRSLKGHNEPSCHEVIVQLSEGNHIFVSLGNTQTHKENTHTYTSPAHGHNSNTGT